MEIIFANENHCSDILHIEKSCFSTPYSKKMIVDMLLNDKYLYILAKCDKICGCVGVNIVFDEADITNIAVLEEYRGRKIAEKLLLELIEQLKLRNVTKLHLEVRESNLSAINLYKKMNFNEISIRKNYYKNPIENAVTYTLEV